MRRILPWPLRARLALADWPLRVKIGLAPLIALAVLVAIGVSGLSSLNGAAWGTRDIVQRDMQLNARLAQAADGFQIADRDLYRLLTAVAANPDGVDVNREAEAIRGRLARVRSELARIRLAMTDPTDIAQIASAEREIQTYADAVGILSTMLAIDFRNAAAMLEPFQANADYVASDIRAITTRSIERSHRRADVIAREVEVGILRFSLLTLMALTATAVVAAAVSAATTRSIREIADATSRLAAADYDLDIGRLKRRDELGAIVTALEVFRQQALDGIRLQAERDLERRRAEEEERAALDARHRQEEERRLRAAAEQHARELFRLATTDSLTGLANRRHFMDQLAGAVEQRRQDGTPLSVAMLDLDFFKKINDGYGHPAGDAVLVSVADTCAGSVRKSDRVGRLGGEEFAILMPCADLTTAQQICERVRQSIMNTGVAYGSGEPIRVTVSIGVTSFEPDDDLDSVMRRADAALYTAKQSGRNRVQAADPGCRIESVEADAAVPA